MTTCRRCIEAGTEDKCIFPGRAARASSRRSSYRSRSRSSDSASSRGGARVTLARLDESDEEEEAVAAQVEVKRYSFAAQAFSGAPDPPVPQPCIACGDCEIVDDGWVIPQHFGVKTYVPIALSPLCPVCNSNTHEFRGRLPRPPPSQNIEHGSVGVNDSKPGPTAIHSTPADWFPPQYREEPTPTVPSPAEDAGQSADSPPVQVTSVPGTKSSWRHIPVFWSMMATLIRSAQTFHLLTMLWIPRYYENQVRHGALSFGHGSQLDPEISFIRSADDASLERTEGGNNMDEDEAILTMIRMLWTEFVDSRVFEWNILMSITLVLIASSPTIFQIPSANDDRLIRTLAFLSISRAIAGLVHGIILSLHFRSPLIKSMAYIRRWSQESRAKDCSALNFWVVVSLPASSTDAIFGLIWRTDVLHDKETDDNALTLQASLGAAGEHAYLITSLRAAITALFLVDVAYAGWALVFLRRRARACMSNY
ncbi:hypothetical protein NMY22_g12885 [Coprinellus aureogranulatus]|nr:hypothetical protein NMY22_g12885 [Coprinellus aureogranulatus]